MSEKELDFLEETGVGTTALEEVMFYVTELEKLDAEIENLEEKTKNLKDQRDKLSGDVIPKILEGNSLSELKLTNGKRISIKENLYCRIPEDPINRETALAWLADNGGEDKIKDEVTIDEVTPDLLEELTGIGAAFSRRRTVNPRSLQSWFNEVLGYKKGSIARMSQEDIPKVFNVFVKKETKIG